MLLKLKVHPASGKSAVARKACDAYEVWARAPAENGRANREALETLAKAVGRPAKKFVIVKGSASPNKLVKVYD
ncbi:MAG: DUF167 domain-containing protein [Elusimicrobia bacterium]|nr:DUF167 domain-containing protein [Elusimicrobiota bacterium]MDE2236868.1 DUF167 domain-containing protein [Elusimicrobiota bacterium]MDE2425392.1 DUF167 domain-containing protein [Elusimicrobiota bacterium]